MRRHRFTPILVLLLTAVLILTACGNPSPGGSSAPQSSDSSGAAETTVTQSGESTGAAENAATQISKESEAGETAEGRADENKAEEKETAGTETEEITIEAGERVPAEQMRAAL